MRKAFALLLVFIIFVPLQGLHAQIAGSVQDLIGDFSLTSSPQFPSINQETTVTVQNYSIDLMTATETWTVNGKVVASGQGVTNIKVRAGDQGVRTAVSVSVSTGDQTYTRSLSIEPAAVDLMWQGKTYAPPLYAGRSLWGESSNVTILAVPHVGRPGDELNPKSLIYKWSVNDEVQGDKSGVGRNTLTIDDNPLSLPQNVSVQIMSDSSTEVAEGELTIAPTTPSLVVYEDNPLYGIIFEHAITDSVTITDPEVSFAAFPLALDISSRNDPDVHYSWSVNGSPNYQYGNKVTYRAPATSGKSQVTVAFDEKNNSLSATNDFLVQFGNGQNGI